MTTEPEVFDCLSCSACCRGAGDGTVLVTAEDLVRFRAGGRADLEASLVPGHFGLEGLPSRGGACLQLGTADGPNHCAVYELRPESCRLLEPGSPQCKSYRRDNGLRPGP